MTGKSMRGCLRVRMFVCENELIIKREPLEENHQPGKIVKGILIYSAMHDDLMTFAHNLCGSVATSDSNNVAIHLYNMISNTPISMSTSTKKA